MNKIIFKNKKNTLNKRGFTLVETLVALFIFAISITAIMVVSGQGIYDTNIAKNKITANALAQEGIEIIRAVRDTSVLSELNPGEGWEDFKNKTLLNCAYPNGCFVFDLDSFFYNPTILECNTGITDFPSSCPFLKREKLQMDANSGAGLNSIGFYSYDSVFQNSPFQRTIFINCVSISNCFEVKVESIVAWRQGSKIMTINSTEYLFNWFKTNPNTP